MNKTKQVLESEYITLAQLRRIVDTMKDMEGATKITMDYVCSWFVKSYDQFQKNMNKIYLDGYLAGKKDALEELDK